MDDAGFTDSEESQLNITLPFPPSVNSMWRNVRGRTLLSSAGRRYRTAAIAAALSARPMAFGNAPVSVSISAWYPDARRRDLDNLPKGIFDALMHAGIFDDDSQVQEISIKKRGIDRVSPRVEVDVRIFDRVAAGGAYGTD